MTRIGDIGTAKVIKSDEKYAFYVSLALLKPKHINSDFLCNSIASKNFQKGLKARSLLTAIPLKINKEEMRVCNFLWAARSRLIDVGGDSVTK